MRKYIVIYHAPISFGAYAERRAPEEMKAGMEAWMAWFQSCGEWLVDMGGPLGGGLRVTSAGSSPSERNVVAYSVIQAENAEAAHALIKDHPHIGWADGCEIEIHECMTPPG